MELKVFDYDLYEKDIASQRVADKIKTKLEPIEGMWLYREPEMKTEGNLLPSFTILSPNYGIIFIKAFDYNLDTLTHIEKKYWTINGQKVLSECKRFRNYVHKITGKIADPLIELESNIPTNVFYIFPYIDQADFFRNIDLSNNEKLLCGENFVLDFVQLNCNVLERDFRCISSIIQNANIINQVSNIYIEEPARNISEAIVLNNKRIALFDSDQMEASLTITDKSERIRGLAGSGKTVLLAMKAAKLHSRFPNKKIAFIFYTKSLYFQAINLIRKYYYQLTDDEPNWQNLLVMHSWGGYTVGNGFYYSICKECGVTPKTYRQGQYSDLCQELLDLKCLKEMYDFILIDEAQDFPLEFFKVVYQVAKAPKKIVVAYDELQSTNDITIPEFSELFGESNGIPNISLDAKHDYILKKSYRNTIDVLITAFSFGFGFYSDLTQIIQDKTTWEALGFTTDSQLVSGEKVIINRPNVNSPNSVTDIYKKVEPVNWAVFDNDVEVIENVVNKIFELIEVEKVIPTDILVIDIKKNKENILNLIQNGLYEKGIESHIPGIVSDAREFFRDGKVTLSTPRNAKGNEVPIVIIVGCEDIYSKVDRINKRQARNFMFISITRSKGWVYLFAAGRVKTSFQNEIKSIQKNSPNMIFEYPSKEKIQQLSKIDFLSDNPKAKTYDDDIIRNIKKAISAGDTEILKHLIELDPSLRATLKKMLEE